MLTNNLKNMLFIYFLLIPNLIDALKDNSNTASISNKLKQGRAILKNPKEYILNVAQEFVHELEEFGFCNFEFSNFSHKIDQTTYFGRIVKGNIHYKNGFIGTVNEIGLLQDPGTGTLDEYENTAEFSLKMHMLNLMTFFDFTADLTEIKFSGTVAIPISDIIFNIWIKKYFYSNLMEYNVTIDTSSVNTIPIVWFYEPDNSYTQIINRYSEPLDFQKDLNLIASKYWYKSLENVINKIPFPELCLFCTET